MLILQPGLSESDNIPHICIRPLLAGKGDEMRDGFGRCNCAIPRIGLEGTNLEKVKISCDELRGHVRVLADGDPEKPSPVEAVSIGRGQLYSR
jgi:hypothetical protein